MTALEARAALQAFKWRHRNVQFFVCRFLHLVDNQSVLGVLSKCRSSSYVLHGIAAKSTLALPLLQCVCLLMLTVEPTEIRRTRDPAHCQKMPLREMAPKRRIGTAGLAPQAKQQARRAIGRLSEAR